VGAMPLGAARTIPAISSRTNGQTERMYNVLVTFAMTILTSIFQIGPRDKGHVKKEKHRDSDMVGKLTQ
jgi:hypothetical protein